MDNTILNTVTDIFKQVLQHDNVVLTPTTTTNDVDGWESATHMMIITDIEAHFQIEFELDELWNMKHIGDLIALIEAKTNG